MQEIRHISAGMPHRTGATNAFDLIVHRLIRPVASMHLIKLTHFTYISTLEPYQILFGHMQRSNKLASLNSLDLYVELVRG